MLKIAAIFLLFIAQVIFVHPDQSFSAIREKKHAKTSVNFLSFLTHADLQSDSLHLENLVFSLHSKYHGETVYIDFHCTGRLRSWTS